MKCYSCGYPIDSNFKDSCHVCGAVFSKTCGKCNNYNPKYANFCLICGEKLDKEHNEVKIKESRKNVGVLFADISGFTSLAEKLDPEETRDIINECFQRITKPAYELGGIIDKYIGDCVMILFGAVHSHVDDPLRAVECALKMKKEIDEFSSEKISKLGMKLDLTIGVNYGLVVTGKVGNLYDTDQTVIGDVVNTASRLQSGAVPGEILVSESIYNETHTIINYKNQKSIKAKNKDKEITCYEPISSNYYKVEDTINLINRVKEMSLLDNFFATEEQGNIVEIIGSQGTGKTVLLNMFLNSCEFETKQIDINVLSSHKTKPYSGLSLLIHSLINLNPEVSIRAKRNRLISYTDYILADKTDEEIIRNYNFIAIILGLEKDNDYEDIINSMAYPDLVQELRTQTNIFFANATSKQKLLVTFDNAHYLDNKSTEILSYIDGIKGYIIYVSRHSIFNESQNFKLKVLNFTENEVSIFVEKNVIYSLRKSDQDYIYTMSNGNPLYLTELTRLINKNTYVVDNEGYVILTQKEYDLLPKTMKSMMTSKIDELDPSITKFLEIAALIGEEFDVSVPLRLMKYDKNYDEFIGKLLSLNIIELTSHIKINNHLIRKYKFIQKEMKEVLENRILKREKIELHERIAALLKEEYKDSSDRHYDEIGYQYEMADKIKIAKKYYYDNAILLQDVYLYDDAISYYRKYLNIEKKLNKYKTEPKVLQAIIEIAKIYNNTSDFDNAIETIQEGLQLNCELDSEHQLRLLLIESYKALTNMKQALEELSSLEKDLQTTSRLYGKMLQLQCTLYNMTGKPGVIELADQSKAILLKSKDYESIAETMTQSGIRYFIDGDVANGITYLTTALEYAEKGNNKAILSKIMINLGILYDLFGERNKSHSYFKESIKISKLISNARNQVSAAINLGVSYLNESMFVDAQELLEEAVQMSKKANLIYQECVTLSNLGDIKFELGNFKEAILLYKESKTISEMIEMPIETAINKLGIAKSHIMIEKFDTVESVLKEALEIFEESKELAYFSSCCNVLADYYLIQSNYDSAIKYAEEGLDKAKVTKNTISIVKSKRIMLKVLLSRSQVNDAEKLIKETIEVANKAKLHSESSKINYISYSYLKQISTIKAKEYLKNAYNESLLFDYCYISSLIKSDCEKEKII